MRTANTEAFCLEIQNAYQIFNQILFEGSLPKIKFSVLPKRKCAIKFIHEEHSIIIGGEFSDLDQIDILPCLLHEMVHVFNYEKGIEDVTANQYHTTKHFLPLALSVGLVVIKHKSQGWSITSLIVPRNVIQKEFVRKPEQSAIQKRNEAFGQINMDKALFLKVQNEIKKVNCSKPIPKTFFLKYICNCPPPHNSIRSGRRPDGANALNLMCGNCGSRLVCVSDSRT